MEDSKKDYNNFIFARQIPKNKPASPNTEQRSPGSFEFAKQKINSILTKERPKPSKIPLRGLKAVESDAEIDKRLSKISEGDSSSLDTALFGGSTKKRNSFEFGKLAQKNILKNSINSPLEFKEDSYNLRNGKENIKFKDERIISLEKENFHKKRRSFGNFQLPNQRGREPN